MLGNDTFWVFPQKQLSTTATERHDTRAQHSAGSVQVVQQDVQHVLKPFTVPNVKCVLGSIDDFMGFTR